VLFPDRPRSDPRPATTEGLFEFLDLVSGSYWDALRGGLNAWFARYPNEHQPDLRKRLFDEDKAESAFWELLLPWW
jgi:hypothetical protein